jgi:uncharacterized protein (DUF486 family)
MKFIYTFLLWFLLNICIVIAMQFALFSQITPEMKDTNIFEKLLTSEFWATIEWFFIVPAQRIGNTFLTAPQLALSSYIFNFLSQIWSNSYWLNIKTTIDDYIGMLLILFGMYVAKYTLFG